MKRPKSTSCDERPSPKDAIKKIRKLMSCGYSTKICDNVSKLRYEFYMFKRHKLGQEPLVDMIPFRYEDLAVLFYKASPGLSKTYEGLEEQIRELQAQKVAILDKLAAFIEFPVSK